MTKKFVYLETKRPSSKLSIVEIVDEIKRAIIQLSESDFYETENMQGFLVEQSIIGESEPAEPWNLVPARVKDIKESIYKTSKCRSLKEIVSLRQGVTPGGGSLEIFLVDEDVAVTLEPQLVRFAITAEDISDWTVGNTGKYLIYPYRGGRKPFNLGHLDHNLSEEDAKKEIDRLIVNRKIKQPRTAKYLAGFFESLAHRGYKKKSIREHGLQWYEYYWPRDSSLIGGFPKIVTRRMTKDVMFALDDKGMLPTDGVEVLIPKAASPLKKAFQSAAPDIGARDQLVYLLSILNSKIVEFLLKSTSDFWQGNYFAVREDFLKGIPVRLPQKSTLETIQSIIAKAKDVFSGHAHPGEVDSVVFKLYGQEENFQQIESYLRSKR